MKKQLGNIAKYAINVVGLYFLGAVGLPLFGAMGNGMAKLVTWVYTLPIWTDFLIYPIVGYAIYKIWQKIPKQSGE